MKIKKRNKIFLNKYLNRPKFKNNGIFEISYIEKYDMSVTRHIDSWLNQIQIMNPPLGLPYCESVLI